MLEMRSAIDAEALERAVGQLVAHHDALRLRFVQEGIGWRQFNAEREGEVPFLRVDLAGLGEAEERCAVEITARDWQSSLNLSEGPLIRVIYFDAGASKAGRLLLIVHHLAVDAVSWRILLEDLETAYRQAHEGREITLAPKTTSFKQWAERLLAYAESDEARRAADYWLSDDWLEAGTLPADRESQSDREAPPATRSEASASMVWVELDGEETQALLHEVPQAFRTQVNEVLLAALGRVLSRWCGARSVAVDVEGHGRESLFRDVDVSRTVGWFTTIYPVLLTAGETDADEVEVLKNVKEQLRAVPNRGIDHGVLLHLGVESGVARSLKARPRAEVLFNYLGRLDRALPEHSLFQLSAESCGPVRSPRARRSHLLEINGYVTGGRLRMEWTYSEDAQRRGVVEALAESFKEYLQALIARRHSAGAGEATPSDFPLTQLSQEQLDEALSEVTFDD
jgi:non-ribosomal peptide synthase protein (TIGR01720 family)